MRRFIQLAILCGLAHDARGQSTPLTLPDCVRLALAAPSALTLARQDARIAGYGVRAARAGFLPQAQLGNAFTYNSPASGSANLPGTGSFVALNGVHEYQSALGASWEIDTSGRLRAALARARADQQIAGTNAALAARDLKRAVSGAYFRVLLARRLVKADRDVLAEAESFAERTRLLVEGGEAARADVVKAASQVSFSQQALRAAELEARIANAELASFWTADVEPELDLVDTLETQPPPEPAPAAPQPFMRRPEFDLYAAQRRGFEADYRRERSFLLPQLTFNFQYGLDSNRVTLRDRGQAAFFTFNIPLFDWFRTRSLAGQFQVRSQQADTQRDISTRFFSREYQTARSRVQLIYEQIPMTEAQVKTSEENLKLARVRYEGGEGPALDVVAAQSQLAQARTNYFQALANYASAKSDLEVAAGR
ncbi:MAG TPA: TolC family protein [Bryobacteraceae bacterium]|nr:TolC family protein [Bryobacteraceae bacterium]